jgi:hypothetical protein
MMSGERWSNNDSAIAEQACRLEDELRMADKHVITLEVLREYGTTYN